MREGSSNPHKDSSRAIFRPTVVWFLAFGNKNTKHTKHTKTQITQKHTEHPTIRDPAKGKPEAILSQEEQSKENT